MASSQEFLDYACERLREAGELRTRKMFGDYLIYVDDKPVILSCDNTLFLKRLPALAPLMHSGVGVPYPGAKEHYLLDPDDADACRAVRLAAGLTPLPKKKAPRATKKD